jgi:hypothetical protein
LILCRYPALNELADLGLSFAHLLADIGEWVLRQACATARDWPDAVRVAVNVSASQLKKPGFLRATADALEESGLSSSLLELEISELTLSNGNKPTLDALRELRGLPWRTSAPAILRWAICKASRSTSLRSTRRLSSILQPRTIPRKSFGRWRRLPAVLPTPQQPRVSSRKNNLIWRAMQAATLRRAILFVHLCPSKVPTVLGNQASTSAIELHALSDPLTL